MLQRISHVRPAPDGRQAPHGGHSLLPLRQASQPIGATWQSGGLSPRHHRVNRASIVRLQAAPLLMPSMNPTSVQPTHPGVSAHPAALATSRPLRPWLVTEFPPTSPMILDEAPTAAQWLCLHCRPRQQVGGRRAVR